MHIARRFFYPSLNIWSWTRTTLLDRAVCTESRLRLTRSRLRRPRPGCTRTSTEWRTSKTKRTPPMMSVPWPRTMPQRLAVGARRRRRPSLRSRPRTASTRPPQWPRKERRRPLEGLPEREGPVEKVAGPRVLEGSRSRMPPVGEDALRGQPRKEEEDILLLRSSRNQEGEGPWAQDP